MRVCVAHDVFIPLCRTLFEPFFHNFRSFSFAFYSICAQFTVRSRNLYISYEPTVYANGMSHDMDISVANSHLHLR